jgi:hypothetical protein
MKVQRVILADLITALVDIYESGISVVNITLEKGNHQDVLIFEEYTPSDEKKEENKEITNLESLI